MIPVVRSILLNVKDTRVREYPDVFLIVLNTDYWTLKFFVAEKVCTVSAISHRVQSFSIEFDIDSSSLNIDLVNTFRAEVEFVNRCCMTYKPSKTYWKVTDLASSDVSLLYNELNGSRIADLFRAKLISLIGSW